MRTRVGPRCRGRADAVLAHQAKHADVPKKGPGIYKATKHKSVITRWGKGA